MGDGGTSVGFMSHNKPKNWVILYIRCKVYKKNKPSIFIKNWFIEYYQFVAIAVDKYIVFYREPSFSLLY